MTKSPSDSPRPLDHVVLPTADLAIARQRLTALGFTVSPVGIHPFGTVNCCVYLGDGTFLEPLAIGDSAAAGEAVAAGNVFVGRDSAFRNAHGDEGFSAVVFGTNDADADHSEFVAAGVSAGPRLDFSRPFVDASGKSDVASFRLAFAAEPGSQGDAFLFTCERVNAPDVDRSALQAHANGARRVLAVEASVAEPAAAADLLATVARSSVDAVSEIPLSNARLAVRAMAGSSGLRLDAMVFAVDDLAVARELLARNGIAHDLSGQRLVIPPAPGQGAAFIFEEKS
ncbi:catechol 2,3-dioxygenase-like lactoylglutathione lyase family enzyme [Aminobacter niigataensis]|uniref:Catechol 2,3-dioxygenase-like lactoylglutathione lyase family enzyme n=1 Tax=Aminobacter niigataensis TaxID=83265 RepID=A0ABR6KXJ6_9HYPH|nr:VOC family protein [Aminobacter niigataensis]MBB4649153.1 catechol 2,3-dioxygenase-like lactoylglutathione lyase family enzyme [Aminobacter niigataensis]